MIRRMLAALCVALLTALFACGAAYGASEDEFDVESLHDLYIWNDALLYGYLDESSVILCGSWSDNGIPEEGTLIIPDRISGRAVKVVARYAFSSYENIYRVIIPGSADLIGNQAFADCPLLSDVIIEDGVKRIWKAFQNCPSLIRVVIPESVTEIEPGAFDGSSRLFFLSVTKGSYAERFAKENGIPYRYTEKRRLDVAPGNIVQFGNSEGEPVEWRVLDVEDGEALLVSRDILATHRYDSGKSFWYNCEMRDYLSNTLFYSLFNSDEAAVIAMRSIRDPASPYEIEGISKLPSGARLFLLSYYEARDLFPSEAERQANGAWWLRTQSDDWEYAHLVNEDGSLGRGKKKDAESGVRPALWIRLDEAGSAVRIVDDSTWEEHRNDSRNTGFVQGGIVQFGSYEQDNNSDDGKEPLSWIVLDISETEAVLITRYCIDVQQYHDSQTPVNWGDCSLRNWLNSGFLDDAFSDAEKATLVLSPVKNFDTDAAANTLMYSSMIPPVISYDYAWILTEGEANAYMPGQNDKLAKLTKYASAKGASENIEGYGNWLLRTDKNDRGRANIMVAYQGSASVAATRSDASVRPVVKVDLVTLGIVETERIALDEMQPSNAFAERWAASGDVIEDRSFSFALMITDDGQLWSWGDNTCGQLGDGTLESRTYPVRILSDVKAVSTGFRHGVALLRDGSVWTWGANDSGQLGDGSFTGRLEPQRIMDDVVSISADGGITMALKKDGTVWSWGCNDHGQQGDGTTVNRAVPTCVFRRAIGIEAGAMTCFVIRADGTLWACGSSDNMFCDGTNKDSYVYIKMMDDVTAVSAGAYHVLALRSDGGLWSWGENDDGRAGVGEGHGDAGEPVRIMDNVASFSAGRYHSSCVDMDGNVYAFGTNGYGQIGNGRDWGNVFEPEQVLQGATAVLSCMNDTLAVMEDGSIWGWGSNENGILVNGAQLMSLVPARTNLRVDTLDAYSPFEYEILPDGTARLTGYYGSGGRVEIPSEIDGHAVSIIGNSTFEVIGDALISAVIPDTITEIEDFAFYQCVELAEAYIPSSVTNIGSAAFYGCSDKLRIYGDSRSYASGFAKEAGIAFVFTNADE